MSRLIGIFVLVCKATLPGSQLIGILSASEPQILRAYRIAKVLDETKHARLRDLILKEAEQAFFAQREALTVPSEQSQTLAKSGILKIQNTVAHAMLAFSLFELGKFLNFKRGSTAVPIFREIARETKISQSHLLRVILPALKFIREFGFLFGVNAALINFFRSPSFFLLRRIQHCLDAPGAVELKYQRPLIFRKNCRRANFENWVN